ncbi:hypothetical protein ACTQ6A_05555 [Lachnospiraceae bacterium LCP25S3_G4]
MKRKIRWLIFSIVVIGATYLYSYIEQPEPIYSEAIAVEEYVSCEEIVGDYVIEQEFVAKQDTIKGVKIKCRTFNDKKAPSADIIYSIKDKSNGEIVAKGKVNASKIKNSKFYEFEFNELTSCKGKTYVFTITSKNGMPGESISVYKTQATNRDTHLKVNGDEVEGTLVLRTISHIFSWETFFVVICFVIYIFVFIKVLYKFFR